MTKTIVMVNTHYSIDIYCTVNNIWIKEEFCVYNTHVDRYGKILLWLTNDKGRYRGIKYEYLETR
jgi:hypothetical protein